MMAIMMPPTSTHHPMTTKSTGTGVGLAVVRKIIERHGGTIALEAAVPHGARFVLDLPAA